jgi:hypothetical protein
MGSPRTSKDNIVFSVKEVGYNHVSLDMVSQTSYTTHLYMQGISS